MPIGTTTPSTASSTIAFVNADWHNDTLDGFFYKHHHFMHRQVFNSNQFFSIIEIPSGSTSCLSFAADSILTPVTAFASRDSALAAINGSFFDMRTGIPVCYLRINGKELGENTPSTACCPHDARGSSDPTASATPSACCPTATS